MELVAPGMDCLLMFQDQRLAVINVSWLLSGGVERLSSVYAMTDPIPNKKVNAMTQWVVPVAAA